MPTKRLLLQWIGHSDLRAMAASLPEPHRDAILAEIKGPVPDGLTKRGLDPGDSRENHGEQRDARVPVPVLSGPGGDVGPTKTLLDTQPFDEICLLSNYRPEWNKLYRDWLGAKAKIVRAALEKPTDYVSIFQIADGELAKIRKRTDWPDIELCLHLSPGTPAMAAVWLLLGKTRYPATFYETFAGKSWVTQIPFDLTIDVIPEVLRNPDLQLRHLAAESPSEITGFEQITGDCQALRIAVGRAKRAAMRSVPVLLLGESGTGKEMFARAIHDGGPRRKGPFVPVNCAAVSRDLLESELFGHEKGAFTGADRDRVGAFEHANGGTLFLDEVGECDAAMQAKLLRALQPDPSAGPCQLKFRPVGDTEERSCDVRVIAATNRDLLKAVNESRFREDLYYRLAVITIRLPALQQRKADIPGLVERLLGRINKQFRAEDASYRDKSVCDDAISFVKRHHWPGNIRQLHNVLLQATVMSDSDVLRREDFEAALAETLKDPRNQNALELPLGNGFNLEEHLNDIQRHYLRRAMSEARGVLAEATRLLGMDNYQTLSHQLKRLDVEGDWK